MKPPEDVPGKGVFVISSSFREPLRIPGQWTFSGGGGFPQGDRARRVSDFELASRLSYTIWGSAPDRELLKLADERRFYRQGE
ncbi:MAG: DUF1592 domain-containing protein [Verrucomicrobiales bacterium]|nr:DUF1592 domain-containing protein [Verrucomicrobiales bacterium]